jgi:hypothetical protein
MRTLPLGLFLSLSTLLLAGSLAGCPGDTGNLDTGATDVLAALDAPAAVDAPAALDAPASTDTPVASDAPAASDAPVASDAPIASDAPVASDAPAASDAGPAPGVCGDGPCPPSCIRPVSCVTVCGGPATACGCCPCAEGSIDDIACP